MTDTASTNVCEDRHIDSLGMHRHYRAMQNVTIEFAGEDLELVEQACRELAERARRDAEVVKGTSVEPAHQYAQRRFLGMAERLKVARTPDPRPSNLRVLMRSG
jgi:cell division GTPase FtsZ